MGRALLASPRPTVRFPPDVSSSLTRAALAAVAARLRRLDHPGLSQRPDVHLLRARWPPGPWSQVVIDRLADWYTCAIFTPLFFWVVRAIPWERARWWRSVSVQALVALACVPIKYFMYAGIVVWLISDYRSAVVGSLIVSNIVTEFMAFAAMFAVIHAVEFNRRAMEDTARAARLEARLAEARLEILTAQLQPHFLFNTLHAISTLMHGTSTRPIPSCPARRSAAPHVDGAKAEVRWRGDAAAECVLDIATGAIRGPPHLDVRIATETTGALVRFVLSRWSRTRCNTESVAPWVGRVTIQAARWGSMHLSVSDDGPGGTLQGNGFPREVSA